MKIKNILMTIGVCTLAACGTDAPQNPELLKGQNFQTSQDGTNITLSFDATEMRVYGGVVNRYNGGYTAIGNKITFTPFASTMMMGDPTAMAAEQKYFAFMSSTENYKLKKDTLIIKNTDGREIVFKKLPVEVK